ncbi:MAG: EcsC family protein [Clostridia bacterium]|nr:EcsC family protein [Clostridia bacterium]
MEAPQQNPEKQETKKPITNESILKFLNEIYKKVNQGAGVIPPIESFANDYLVKETDPRKAVENMVKVQCTKSAISGILSGFGGFITLPVALPANITSVIIVQMRMIAATAYMAGYDISSDQVQTLVYACLAGVSIVTIVKKAGIEFGVKLGKNMVGKIPGRVLIKINQKVGFRFLTKFGTKGIINIGKMIPVVGAVIGGGFDLVETSVIGNRAIKMFFDGDLNVGTEVTEQEEKQAEDMEHEQIEACGTVK